MLKKFFKLLKTIIVKPGLGGKKNFPYLSEFISEII